MLGLCDIPFFAGLSQADLHSLSEFVHCRSVPAGTIVCQRGDTGRYFYAIASGRMKVMIPSDRQKMRMHIRLGPGEVFGEMSLLTESPISTSIIADTDSCLYVLSSELFLHLLEANPRLYKVLVQLLSKRLRQMNEMTIPRSPCALLIPFSESVPQTSIANKLLQSVRICSPASCLIDACPDKRLEIVPDRSYSIEEIPSFFPREPNPIRTTGAQVWKVEENETWLRNLIERWRSLGCIDQYLILLVSQSMARTLMPLLEYGDVVAGIRQDNDCGNDRKDISDLFLKADFTWIYYKDEQYSNRSGSTQWGYSLRKNDLDNSDRLDEKGNYESDYSSIWSRMARWITRREIGLALGTGAARGLAHLGGLQVLAENRIPVDVICGTSIGGIIAILYAFTGSATQSLALAQEYMDRNKKIKDISWLPRSAFLMGKKVHLAAKKVFGDHTFEDLSIPSAVVATDLCSGHRVVFDRGSVVEAIRATSAIPGIFPPLISQGRILVDGALITCIPVDILDGRRCGMRIAINVAPTPGISLPGGGVDLPSLDRHFSRVFSFKEVMTRSWSLLAWWHGANEARQADVVIEPSTSRYPVYDFDSFPYFVESGRKAVEEKLKSIQSAVSGLLKRSEVNL